ncbi:MAG: thioredoxin domain-containing protein [Candidatus Thorarchaeota archaeon]
MKLKTRMKIVTAESKKIKVVNQGEFPSILESSNHVIIDFAATWCAPCTTIKSALEEIAPSFPQILFCSVDIDKNPDLADQYQVDAVPTLVFIENGYITHRTCGFLSYEKLNNDIKRFLGQKPDDISNIFADGEIWYLDGDDANEILKEVSNCVLLFSGTNHDDYTSMRRKLASLAREFSGKVFFGLLDSEDCTTIRRELKISRKQTTIVLIKDGEVRQRFLGRHPSKDTRKQILEKFQISTKK